MGETDKYRKVLVDSRHAPNDTIGRFGIRFGGKEIVCTTDGCRYLCDASKLPLNQDAMLFQAGGKMPLSIRGP